MIAAEIAAALGDARREGRAWRCRCPLHGGRSLVLCDGDRDRLLIKCWAGCDTRSVLAELRRLGLRDRRRHDYAPLPRLDGGDAARTARALGIWREATPVSGTIVETYFRTRGIILAELPADAGVNFRFHERCPHPSGAVMPALVALVEHVERGPVGIHRTFLNRDGSGKANVTPGKASLGPVGGGAVRLGRLQEDRWFCIAEGIETAASVALACALPAWSALSAGGMRSLVLPPEMRTVVIATDNDRNGVGQCAAQEAAQRWLSEGRRTRVVLPPLGYDFNDVLLGRVPTRIVEVCDVAA